MNHKSKILVIGNNNLGKPVFDGGRIKTRLYYNLCLKEGFDTKLLDICNWKKRAISILFVLNKAIKEERRIIVMAGPKGCRFFITVINLLNRKNKCKLVFCPLGVGTVDKLIKNLTVEKVNDFITAKNFSNKKDKYIAKCLLKYENIIVQNDDLKKCYEKFYNLSNVHVLNNFRLYDKKTPKKINNKNSFNICFISRVTESKGIYDLIDAVNNITPKINKDINLNIYGELQLKNKNLFDSKLNNNIKYNGCVKPDQIFDIISKYDLFVLPTKYHGEGMPGSLVESFLANTPVLISSFPNALKIIKHNYNGFVFEIGNRKDLENKLIDIINNEKQLASCADNAKNLGLKYTYEYNRDIFIDKFCGGKE